MSDSYFGDVVYDVWRMGGNPDAIDRDDVEDDRADGYYADEAANREYARQTRRRHDA